MAIPTGFGKIVAKWRKARGWNQKKLAEEVRIDSQTISRIERGGKPHPGNAERIIEVLQIPQHELTGEPPKKPIPLTLRLVAESEGITVTLGEWSPKPGDWLAVSPNRFDPPLKIDPLIPPEGVVSVTPQRPAPEELKEPRNGERNQSPASPKGRDRDNRPGRRR